MDFKRTLNLPDPAATIPMKANLGSLEPRIQAMWDATSAYDVVLESRKDDPTFLLHDGPPYTNGPIHMGTALNKILKDFVLKSRTMMGFKCPYVPGFDNHGLPIEQAVTKKLKEAKVEFDGDRLRKEARLHAQSFIDEQTAQFRRLGVLGRWDRPYATMDPRQEAETVRVFGRLVEKGLVYRGLRPVQWSPTLRTALADTEIVYKDDHESVAIHVAFPVLDDPDSVLPSGTEAVIWTTTPWTIPANRALAFGPDVTYTTYKSDKTYLVAEARLEVLKSLLGEGVVGGTLPGSALENVTFRHPLLGHVSRAVLGDHVTTEDGTGIVHTAPSHGREDFLVGQQYGLEVPDTLDAGGVMTAAAGRFEGTYWKQADTVVVDALREAGALVDARKYVHSYPYGERDEQPVLFRATEQWFVNVDTLKPAILAGLESVKFYPPSGKNRLQAMLANRPDWCVSRQRPWGVGIPIFYGKTSGEPVMDPVAIEAVAKLVEKGGSDAWFVADPKEILPEGYTWNGETEFTKETDTLDVWFDSGATSLTVLKRVMRDVWEEENLEVGGEVSRDDEPTPTLYPEWADLIPPSEQEGSEETASSETPEQPKNRERLVKLYLEGSDQHRGWFNTSAILGTALRGKLPYTHLVTHGFVTDSQGRKMAKRLGNVVDPVKAAEQYGADVLRLWVANADYTTDVPCTDAILKQAGETYRTLRNTLRFLMSNAEGYGELMVADNLQGRLDRYILGWCEELTKEVKTAYVQYRFRDVVEMISGFCRDDLSKFYLDAIKDRLYCDDVNSDERRSAVFTCQFLLDRLTLLLAPIIPHTAEEVWQHGCLRETILSKKLNGEKIYQFFAENEMRWLRLRRELVASAFEKYKGTDGISNIQDVIVYMPNIPTDISREEWATFLRVSWVESWDKEEIGFGPSPYDVCERSRLRRPDVATATYEGEEVKLTARDRKVLGLA